MGGNQTIVGVGVSAAREVGVMDGLELGSLQEVSSNPHKMGSEGKNLLKRMVRFILLKPEELSPKLLYNQRNNALRQPFSSFYFALLESGNHEQLSTIKTIIRLASAH